MSRRKWWRKKRVPREVKDKYKYKLNNSLANVSKRCKQPRAVIRPWLEETLTNVENGLLPCCYCCSTLTLDSVSFDHKVALSRGGEPWGSNVVACCKTCNKVKGSLNADEYQSLCDLVNTWPDAARDNVTKRLRIGGAFFGRYKRR